MAREVFDENYKPHRVTLIAAALVAAALAGGSAAASRQPPGSFPKEYCADQEGTAEEVCADSLAKLFELLDDNGEDAETPEQVQEMRRLNNPPKSN